MPPTDYTIRNRATLYRAGGDINSFAALDRLAVVGFKRLCRVRNTLCAAPWPLILLTCLPKGACLNSTATRGKAKDLFVPEEFLELTSGASVVANDMTLNWAEGLLSSDAWPGSVLIGFPIRQHVRA